jgi:ankyrin repeat protein
MDESKAVFELCCVGNDANFDVLKAYLEEHPEVKVDLFRDGYSFTALHRTSVRQSQRCTELLLDHKADINALTNRGRTPLILACIYEGNEDTALLLIERGADIHLKDRYNRDALYYCMCTNRKSVAFTLLCCGSDVKEVKIHDDVTQSKENACIAEYKQTHSFIEAYHDTLHNTLSNEARVDTRVGRGSNGIFQEPLERVLEYIGLSMKKNQTVNTSIDGTIKRVLIPNQARSAMYWYDLSKQ